jgi:DNA polymerase III subunit epsilon
MFKVTKTHCAMKTYAKFYGAWNTTRREYGWQKLEQACKQQRIPVENAHNALGDVLMTLALVKKMATTKA